jgi:hypothetical protein
VSGQLLKFWRGQSAANPIVSAMDLALKLRELCGAEGWRLDSSGVILALRWDLDGNEIIIDRFEAVAVSG